MAAYRLASNLALNELLDRIGLAAIAIAPRLGFVRARDLAELILRTRVKQTVGCGHSPDCFVCGRPVVPDTRQPEPTWMYRHLCRVECDDADDLPRMFGAVAADLLHPTTPFERDAVEQELSGVFKTIIAPLLNHTDRCGVSRACSSKPKDPFES
jgi:hypothetical protein